MPLSIVPTRKLRMHGLFNESFLSLFLTEPPSTLHILAKRSVEAQANQDPLLLHETLRDCT